MDFKFLIILILIVDLLLKVIQAIIYRNFIKVNTIFLLIDYLYILGIKEEIKGELNPFR